MILMKIFIFIACCFTLFGLTESVTAECKYDNDDYAVIGSVYQCEVLNDLTINSKHSAVIDKATGTHKNRKADKDVQMFFADNKRIESMPRGLEKVFVNLKGIGIRYGGIKEIHQEDLKELVKLEYLNLDHNDIKILEAGLFDYNPQLKLINFWSNKIIHIDEHVFDNLQKLERLDLLSNECISKDAETKTKAKELINETKEKCQHNEFLTINEELKQLEEAMTSGAIKTCQEIVPELQKLKNQFQQSSISSSAVIKEKIMKISNEGIDGQICVIDGSLVGLERVLADFKNETKNTIASLQDETKKMIDQSGASINQETKKILDRIENMQKVNDEKFEALNAFMKTIIDKLNKIQGS